MKKPNKAELAELIKAANAAGFRDLAPEDQLRALRGTKVERTFVIQRDGDIDAEKRTAWLSIASEEPYERWWGVEILDVRKGSIRDARLKSSAPLLVGHDSDRQVGVIEAFEISPDKRLRVKARFSKAAYAEEIWQDVLDGIRRNTSVGYIIHDLVLEKQEEGVSTYRVTDWEPLEGSLVAVPADHTVGVARSHEPAQPPNPSEKRGTMDKTKEEIAAEQKAAAEKAAAEARAAEQKRVADLMAAGEQYKEHGGPDVAAKLIKDPNGTLEQFREQMLAKIATKKPAPSAEPFIAPTGIPFGDGTRHIIMRGAKLRAFTQPLRFTDGSQMEPIEAAYRSGMWLMAIVTGSERAHKWCKDHGLGGHLSRVMTGDNDAAGGYLVPTEMEQSIIDLREDYGLARRLARRRPMATDTKSVPKRTGGVTAYFIEEDNAGITAADKSWGNVNFVAKTLAALSLISENLEEDSIVDVVDDLAREQAYAMATKEDQCWLIGDGTSTYGGMQGLRTLFDATAYASRVTAASGHDTFAEYDNADLSSVMAKVADFPGLNPVWVASKTFCENVFGRLKRTAGGNSGSDLDARARYGYGGYDAFTSEIMPKDGTQAVTTVEAFFGDFGMSSSFGDRRGIMVKVLRERYAEKLQVGIRGHERFHIINHTTWARPPSRARSPRSRPSKPTTRISERYCGRRIRPAASPALRSLFVGIDHEVS
jgi:HK97 family phage major capsid protein